MWKFIKHEWKYWLNSPMTWIFFLINALLVFGAVTSDNITIGGGVGNVHKNSPYVIQTYYGVMSLVCLLMTTAFMNASANRDFQHGMHQFIFSSPIKKRDYYFGKFIGAVTVAVIPLLGVSFGSMIGPLMPWVEPERYGPFLWSGHIQGLITFGLPNTIVVGVLLYTLAIIFRNNIVSFVGAMLILVLYVVSQGFTQDIAKEWIANILDPFGFQPQSIIGKYMTVDEKNMHPVYLQGAFLLNRLVWLGGAFVILLGVYFRFSFSTKNEKPSRKSKKNLEVNESTPLLVLPVMSALSANKFSWSTLVHLIKFECKSLIKNPTFIIIVTLGMVELVTNLTSFTGGYGTKQYPVTYDVIDAIKDGFYIYMVAIITFYTGVLVWKERDAKINEIQDSTPVKTGLLFVSKLIAMMLAVALILSLTIIMGIIAQAMFGYYNFELGVYIKSLLVSDVLKFGFIIMIALFFHYLINNRYIAYFAFVAFLILNIFIWNALEVNTNMLQYGGLPSVTYSDMNGFGPFVRGLTWYSIYWLLFALLLGWVIFSFYVRGKETKFSDRMKHAGSIFSKNKWMISLCLLLFILCSGFVYYNTKVLNKYDSQKEAQRKRKDYELSYKKYAKLPQPRYYRLDYNIDLLPEGRDMSARIEAYAYNKTNQAINEIHFSVNDNMDSMFIQISGATVKLQDDRLGYRIYKLKEALQPKDSMHFTIKVVKNTKGFENEVSFTQLTQNGTFFNSGDVLPIIGYESGAEISDKNKRSKLKLPKKLRAPKLDENDLVARANTYISHDADWVEVNTTISTSPDQIAIAPGSLLKSWEAKGRKYYQYKLDKSSLNFYSFISARYEVARKKFRGIDIEVYYIKQHAYNVPNMIKSMEKSLDYYITNFGPYYHKQCRIIEFPRYSSFAQAFPGTMPYSEGIGFIVDLREVTKDDIDQVFYVVAHEMAHQYWAHQLIGAEMQGSEMMSEGFAQYSALMVMEKEYGKEKMNKFLKYEMDSYLRGRSSEFEGEQPLMRTESQQYIHYNKASVVLYYLKEMIGEGQVNKALQSLIDSFAYQQAPYVTSLSAVRAFRQVTPDTLQYLITDMFEKITLFSNRVTDATYKKTTAGYEVSFNTSSEKFRSDSLGKETLIPIADYIDIGVFAKPKNDKSLGKALVNQRLRINKKLNTYKFTTKEKPYQVGIDPQYYLIDRIPDDNLKKLIEE